MPDHRSIMFEPEARQRLEEMTSLPDDILARYVRACVFLYRYTGPDESTWVSVTDEEIMQLTRIKRVDWARKRFLAPGAFGPFMQAELTYTGQTRMRQLAPAMVQANRTRAVA